MLAWFLEFGNDEVYYWTYALYPDWSHFDHPPMVGFVIQLFTLNLYFDSEFFIRLGSVVFTTINTWIIYKIACKLSDYRAGLYAVILYTSSVYTFIICGVFILPDTPQNLFWIIALYYLIDTFNTEEINTSSRKSLLLGAIAIGAGLLSKYTTLFLYGGAGLFVLLYNRKWLKTIHFWLFVSIPLLFFIPVLVWNQQNNFISFAFQGERVAVEGVRLHFDYFAREFFGQILYNNPVNWIIIAMALISVGLNRKKIIPAKLYPLLLLTSLPLIITFLIFSLFRETLPHWTAPAYTSLIILAAVWLRHRAKNTLKLPTPVKLSTGLLLVVIIAGMLQIKTGMLLHDRNPDKSQRGRTDFSLDVYGWQQLGEKFKPVAERDETNGKITKGSPIVSFRWFPAANLDYYVARPLGKKVLAMGSLERIHKYAWINELRGGFVPGSDAWFITSGRDFKNPQDIYAQNYESIEAADTIPVIRHNDTVMYYFVYRMKNLIKIPADELYP
jgi:4-amino-4-deoxy-L-arabinose transferase-like glycosyltransferase